ncbi:hypothetical protein WA556_001109, partial [Blastocystis sp. ATCC 50177/Nand II]
MERCFQEIVAGKSGIVSLTSEAFKKCKCRIGAPVPRGSQPYEYNPERYSVKSKERTPNVIAYAVAAAQECVDNSGLCLEKGPYSKDRIGVFISTGIGNIEEIDASCSILDSGKRLSPFFVPRILSNLPASNVSIQFGLKGPCVSNNMACASSAHSILEGVRSIRYNECDAAFVGGTESCIGRLGYFGFGAMHALASHSNDHPLAGSCPFDKRRCGFVMGEGGVVLLLESYERAKARGASILCEVVDGFTNTDAYHITSPCPDGSGAAACMTQLLKKANVQPEQVGYINAHATSTQIGDRAEMQAIHSVFGSLSSLPCISSTKGATGHLLGAAGALEAAICGYALKERVLPPTLNLEETDIDFGFNLIPKKAIKKDVEYALSNSFGFGGVNVSLLFRS